MRTSIPLFALAAFALVAAPAHADLAELTFTLDSNAVSGSPASVNPDPDICLAPNCALFTGTLSDNDTDYSLLFIGIPYTHAADSSDFDVVLSLGNISPAGLLSGDPVWATDGSGNPPNIYQGPIFGIDIPANTPSGVYRDTVYLDVTPTNGTDPFTVSEAVTVVVSPEPGGADLMLAGLAALCGVYRWRRSSAASR
jgi:hypothetical protein